MRLVVIGTIYINVYFNGLTLKFFLSLVDSWESHGYNLYGVPRSLIDNVAIR